MRVLALALLLIVPGTLRQLTRLAVGWSTAMLFGKVPRTREPHLYVMGIGAITWTVAACAVAFPPLANFLLAVIPLVGPPPEGLAWLVMLALAIAIPPIVSLAAMRTLDAADRPRGVTALGTLLLKGYPYTVSLAMIMLGMSVLNVVTAVRNKSRDWTERHVPLIVDPEAYPDVIREIQQVLENGELPVRAEPAGWILRLPTKLLTAVAGSAVKDLLTEHLTILRSDRLEVVLHLSDLVIRGCERDVHRARAVLAEQLAFSTAYLTSDKRANEIEDRLRSIWRDVKDGSESSVDEAVIERLEAVERDLRTLDVSYEEWDVLMREKLLIERSLLQVATGLLRRPKDLTEEAPGDVGAARMRATTESSPGAGTT